MNTAEISDFKKHFDGPPVCPEYLESVDEVGGFLAFETEWIRNSGVSEASSACHEHRTGSETLRLLVEIDQVEPAQLIGIENLVRWQIQLEVAVERSPTHPDFVGLHEFMGGATTDSGRAVTRKFTAWMAARQKERSKLLAQQRSEREELAKKPKGRGRGRGKPKEEDG